MWGSPEQQTGEIGAIANFWRSVWGPVIHNRPHDLGTDLFVQAFGPGLFNHGLFVGVQAKGGSSYFKDPAYDEDGALIGWWYDEPNTRHFDDWVRHGLPHLLVFRTRTSYWVHVTAKAIQVTGKGAKILFPHTRRSMRPTLMTCSRSPRPRNRPSPWRAPLDWEMLPRSGGEAAGVGLEILTLDDDGRIRMDYQFIEG